MKNLSDFRQIENSLTTAQIIFIVLPPNLNQDKVAAGLSLFLSLKKKGRQVSIASSQPMTVEFSSLVGVDKISQKLGGRNLVISFDYLQDSIEKVSYNIENKKFNLVIQPKDGFPPLSTEKIEYFYSGGKADLVLILGASSLADLGEIYSQNKNLFEEEKTFNFNLQSLRAASYSEIVASLLSRLKFPVDVDIASNLLRGLEAATDVFSSPQVSSTTFEAAAFCLRAGARRRGEKPKTPLKPMPAEVSAEKKPVEEGKKELPRDWLEPKIYRGTTRV